MSGWPAMHSIPEHTAVRGRTLRSPPAVSSLLNARKLRHSDSPLEGALSRHLCLLSSSQPDKMEKKP